MSRTALIISILLLGAGNAGAGTFNQAPYIADQNVDVLNKRVANQQFGRDLFGAPYATVVVGNVDIYDRFPYLESRYFQIVSDPSWDRLLMGEVGQGLAAFDGQNTAFGKLNSPRGMSTDGNGRIYLADTNNDRVLVFRAVSEFDRIELVPVFSIDGLNKPYDVAYSDGGTPFDGSDDRLYVANTGKSEVRRYQLRDDEATLTNRLGELGSGTNRFAGPMAIAVGRSNGANNDNVYVSDAHTQRMVHLRDTGAALEWAGAVKHELGLVTSVDTDHWGNVYATSIENGSVSKFTSALFPVAEFDTAVERPRGFHVLFANVTDHRTGQTSRSGRGSGVLVEEWNSQSGIRLLNLGAEMKDASPLTDEPGVRLTLTDHADVTAEIIDPASGNVVARHASGALDAGRQTIRFSDSDYMSAWNEGEYRVVVRATSTYDKNVVSEVTLDIHMNSSGGPALPSRLTSLGNTPNPFNPTTSIRFLVPYGAQRDYNVRVYDVQGRLVRTLAAGQTGSGLQQVTWDGRNDRGNTVSSGVYLYRVEVGPERFTGKMVLLK